MNAMALLSIINEKMCMEMTFDPKKDLMDITYKGYTWHQSDMYKAYIDVIVGNEKERLYFEDALGKSSHTISTGVGQGIKTIYSQWNHHDRIIPLTIETVVWLDDTYGEVHFELIPIEEASVTISEIQWPGSLVFSHNRSDAYTVLPMMQGCLIPSNWKEEVVPYPPARYYERAAYMPWWGQTDGVNGYMAIVESAHDAGYALTHKGDGSTSFHNQWFPSLGRIGYKRRLKMIFSDDLDYVKMCKRYRKHMENLGMVRTLKEKAASNPKIGQLIGSPVIHTGIKTHIEPCSHFYNPERPELNDSVVTFDERFQQLRCLKEKGLDKAYIHVDGWGKGGYDNQHPDILPPCEEAGGYRGMASFADKCSEIDVLFAIHDQYRDYYVTAETYDNKQNLVEADGSIPREDMWAGGEQTVLCPSFAPHYLKRNHEALRSNGVALDGTYLDVFSVIALDECHHEEHKVSRRDCMAYRKECFDYLRADRQIVSSEELVDWALPHIDLCHHAPYALTPDLDHGHARGIPVPLFNLVYHDCVVIPWSLEKGTWGIPIGDVGYLHAVMNAGTGYLGIEAGSEEIQKVKELCEVQKLVAFEQMTNHEFVRGNPRRQRSTYSNGITIEVDFDDEKYWVNSDEK